MAKLKVFCFTFITKICYGMNEKIASCANIFAAPWLRMKYAGRAAHVGSTARERSSTNQQLGTTILEATYTPPPTMWLHHASLLSS